MAIVKQPRGSSYNLRFLCQEQRTPSEKLPAPWRALACHSETSPPRLTEAKTSEQEYAHTQTHGTKQTRRKRQGDAEKERFLSLALILLCQISLTIAMMDLLPRNLLGILSQHDSHYCTILEESVQG